MSPEAFERALIAKLYSQGAKHLLERSTPVSLFFVIEGRGFTVPRSYNQQELIAATLEYCGLEFWPLDCNV
jgi:hypothetical protein